MLRVPGTTAHFLSCPVRLGAARRGASERACLRERLWELKTGATAIFAQCFCCVRVCARCDRHFASSRTRCGQMAVCLYVLNVTCVCCVLLLSPNMREPCAQSINRPDGVRRVVDGFGSPAGMSNYRAATLNQSAMKYGLATI